MSTSESMSMISSSSSAEMKSSEMKDTPSSAQYSCIFCHQIHTTHAHRCTVQPCVCEICGQIMSLWERAEHKKKCEKTEKKCEYCSQTFKILGKHIRVCNAEYRKCKFCNFYFYKKVINTHVESCNKWPLKCDGCNNYYPRYLLDTHAELCEGPERLIYEHQYINVKEDIESHGYHNPLIVHYVKDDAFNAGKWDFDFEMAYPYKGVSQSETPF